MSKRLGGITRFSQSMGVSRLTRGGIAEPVSRDQILKRERGEGIIIHFPCSADHEQDWQLYPVDPYYMCEDLNDIYVVANSVRGLLDRKRSEEDLQSSNESMKTKTKQKQNKNKEQLPTWLASYFLV